MIQCGNQWIDLVGKMFTGSHIFWQPNMVVSCIFSHQALLAMDVY